MSERRDMPKGNSTKARTTQHHHVLWWSVSAAITLLLLGAVGVGAITYERAYEDRIFPGVRVGPIPVGGLTRQAARERLQAVIDVRLNQGVTYILDGSRVTLSSVVIAPSDPDLWYPLIDVDVEAHVDAALAAGRASGMGKQWVARIHGAVGGDLVVPLTVHVHEDRLLSALTENAGSLLALAAPPTLVRATNGSVTVWEVEPGRIGQALDAQAIVSLTRERIATFDPAPIIATTHAVHPAFSEADIRAVLPRLDAALSRAPLQLQHGARTWPIDASTLASWLTLDAQGQPVLDRTAIDAFLKPIRAALDDPARDARLQIDPQTQRVREFTSARDGQHVDGERLTASIASAVFGSSVPVIPIPLERAPPSIALADTNTLGIRELLGVGRTNFAGSPANRRHNIGVGTNLLNGRIIPPGAIFSTVETISPFDNTNGYKQELVIKGNRTIPEFGGGLCQVSTTLFRAALAAGLPIVERRNHAYRVPYYEPPIGMDATIYGPKPDLRFRNDTPAHLLLVTRVSGTEPIYEIWGTDDGRVVEMTEPEVFNYVKPAPKRVVETEDLPPGKEKCIERSHTGADAKFTYTVRYADGRVAETEFTSHYRPWQAVCLIGKDPAAAPAAGAPASDASAPPAPVAPATTEPIQID